MSKTCLPNAGWDVSYETVRRWFLKFGVKVARNLRTDHPVPSDHWYSDEMVIAIRGKRFLNVHSAAYNHFNHQRHLNSRPFFKKLSATAFAEWKIVGTVAYRSFKHGEIFDKEVKTM